MAAEVAHGAGDFEVTEEKLKQFREAFSISDENKDGVISGEELRKAMEVLGHLPTDEQMKNVIAHAHTDSGGNIDFNEFHALMVRWENPQELEKELRTTFQVLDRNNDGFITPTELAYGMRTLGERLTMEEVQAMIRAADIDGDGRVSLEEFLKIGGMK